MYPNPEFPDMVEYNGDKSFEQKNYHEANKCPTCHGTGTIGCDCTEGFGPEIAVGGCYACNGTGTQPCPICQSVTPI